MGREVKIDGYGGMVVTCCWSHPVICGAHIHCNGYGLVQTLNTNRLWFLVDGKIQKNLELSTGDPAKPIFLRCNNGKKTTITGLVIDLRFMTPLALSGTTTALSGIPGKTQHGRITDKDFYWIQHSDLVLPGEENLDFRVELNTTGKTPGSYFVNVTIFSTQGDYKNKKSTLTIKMR